MLMLIFLSFWIKLKIEIIFVDCIFKNLMVVSIVIYGCKVLLLGGVDFGGGLVGLYIDLVVIVDVLDCFLFVK